jgi:DNA-binding CsgD family transcriptional regulator
MPDHWVSGILDQIDYGLVVVDARGTVRHANRAALEALDSVGGALHVQGGTLNARSARDAGALRQGTEDACRRGLRALLSLGTAREAMTLAVVPIPPGRAEGGTLALLVTGRLRVCETLTAQMYALVHGLTCAEARVLELLCAGTSPDSIAHGLRVAVSTVRTQICSIRAKTGAPSVGALMREIALLPPLVTALGSGRLQA